MKITEIRKTKRGNYALFSCEGFFLSVDEETLYSKGLEVGTVLDEDALSSLQEAGNTHKAKEQAMRFLTRRMYAKQELFLKLCQNHDEYSAMMAVAAMEEMQLLCDRQFASEYARVQAEKGKSSRAIFYALREKGIEAELAQDAVEELGQEDESVAAQVMRKKYADKIRQGKYSAVMAAMARRGFSHRDIKQALESVISEQEAE